MQWLAVPHTFPQARAKQFGVNALNAWMQVLYANNGAYNVVGHKVGEHEGTKLAIGMF